MRFYYLVDFVTSLQDEKEQEFDFTFDRVFYQGSEQADIYEFLALPIVQGTIEFRESYYKK